MVRRAGANTFLCRNRYQPFSALYRVHAGGTPDWLARTIVKNDVAIWFNGPNNEQGRMVLRVDLALVKCPVLVLAGELDPIMPIVFSETLVAALPSQLTRFERFADCGHGVIADAPEQAIEMLRAFIVSPDGSSR